MSNEERDILSRLNIDKAKHVRAGDNSSRVVRCRHVCTDL